MMLNFSSCLYSMVKVVLLLLNSQVDDGSANNEINMEHSAQLLSILVRHFHFFFSYQSATTTRRIHRWAPVRVSCSICSSSFLFSTLLFSLMLRDAMIEHLSQCHTHTHKTSFSFVQVQRHHANCKYLIQMTCSVMTTENSFPAFDDSWDYNLG